MADAPVHTMPPPTPAPKLFLAPEDIPNIDNLVIEDGRPVDNIFSERQMRLLVEPLYTSWVKPEDVQSVVALANVGMFFAMGEPPLVPDVLLSLNVRFGDPKQKEHNSYFFWVFGKQPEAVFEIVSNLEGGEDTHKLTAYARLGIIYYVILDPLNLLKGGVLRIFGLHEGVYKLLQNPWLERIGLGLTLWQGRYQDMDDAWLRWCTKEGTLLPTGEERAEQERQRAEQECQRAEQECQRAEQERQRAEQERQRAEKLAEQLRRAGIEPTA
jgi:hypothetical protein